MFNGHLVWWPFFPFVLSLTLFDASSIFSIFLRKIERKKAHFIELKTKVKPFCHVYVSFVSFFVKLTPKFSANHWWKEPKISDELPRNQQITTVNMSANEGQMSSKQKWEHCGEVWIYAYTFDHFLFLKILEHRPLIWKQLQDFSRCFRAAHKS